MSNYKTKKYKSKYITAQQAASIYGVSAKSILNRSLLPTSDPKCIPFLKFGGRRKYFERKVIDRMFQIGRVSS